MRLKLETGDGARRTGGEYGVFGETTGKCVGTVSFDKVPRPDQKSYPTGPFNCSTGSTWETSTLTRNVLSS
jgi:hypothetical protein